LHQAWPQSQGALQSCWLWIYQGSWNPHRGRQPVVVKRLSCSFLGSSFPSFSLLKLGTPHSAGRALLLGAFGGEGVTAAEGNGVRPCRGGHRGFSDHWEASRGLQICKWPKGLILGTLGILASESSSEVLAVWTWSQLRHVWAAETKRRELLGAGRRAIFPTQRGRLVEGGDT
jgi:hypothetical protein